MFVLQPKGLPPDPEFPVTLEEHGFFINEHNQVRKIDNPDERVRYKVSQNDRYNSLRKRSIHGIVMDEITKRLSEIGVKKLYVPQMSTIKPDTKCLPIFATVPDKLKYKDRIVVVIPSSQSELEFFTASGVFDQDGIEEASPIAIAKDLRSEGEKTPGLVVANTSQLLYSHIEKKALSLNGWHNRKRPSMIHRSHVILDEYNCIQGHKTPEDHIHWIFDTFLKNEDFINPAAKIDIIAIRESGSIVIHYLNSHFDNFASQISSIALVHSFYDVLTVKNKKFRTFLADRARSWIWSAEPVNTPIVDQLANVNQGTLCPTFSGGDDNIPELIIIRARKAILEWLKQAYEDPDFINPEYTVVEVSEDGRETVRKLEISKYDFEQSVENIADLKSNVLVNGDTSN